MDFHGEISDDEVLVGYIDSGSLNRDYNELVNKPSINGRELVGNITSEELGLEGGTETDPTVPEYVKNITEEDITSWNNKSDFSGSYDDLTDKPSIPTSTQDITNDSGFITKSVNDLENYYSKGEIDTIINSILGDISTRLSTLTTVNEVNE